MAGLLSSGQRRPGLLSSGYVDPAGYWNDVGASLPYRPGGGVAGNPLSAPPDRSGEPVLMELAAGALPVVGEAMSARDLGQYGAAAYLRAQSGDYGGAARLLPGAALSALGLLPFAGGLAGSLARRFSGPAREAQLASRSAGLYNPPKVPQRPFAADYPAGAQADAAGNLTRTIDGDPIVARWVVGRKVVGGDDVAFPQAELDALTKAGTGRGAEPAPPRQMGRDAGRTIVDRATKKPRQVFLRNDLTPTQALLVHAHEVGHVVDQLAGEVDIAGFRTELSQLYDKLNMPGDYGPQLRTRHLMRPEHQGYRGDNVNRELMAEAVRAYMADPNYVKTHAPKVAEALRKAFNTDPVVSPLVQLNSDWLPFAAGGAAGGAGLLSSAAQQ